MPAVASYLPRPLPLLLVLLYAAFCVPMAGIVLQYIPAGTDTAFLGIKQQYVARPWYLPAFYLHVFIAVLALPAGITQFFAVLRRRLPALHRWQGRIYVVSILAVGAPSGFAIGLVANGGVASRISFCGLALLWWYSSFRAVQEARRGSFDALLAAGCAEQPAPVAQARKDKKAPGSYQPKVETGIEGYCSGDFITDGENVDWMSNTRITFRIDSVRAGTIFGNTIVAGNLRPFQGTLTRKGAGWTFTAREPGDDPHDGAFTAYIDKEVLDGGWECFDNRVKFPKRRYELTRRTVRYDPKLMPDNSIREAFLYATRNGEKREEEEALVGEYFSDAVFRLNASTRTLQPSDLENLYKADLELLRNAIYARHGYSFRNPRMRTAFDHSVDWYVPVSADVTGELTPLERKNIALIKRYEQHAEKYYDSFGR
ncbi:YARHG domain-containing protein [Flaviaesturariibacter flavus]|uniref:YARHG domain-containing protein n=1 Tax=Flaviaesturariibacter flavus TaxID=2502780 RepID=A0A4R1B9H9_9BACT|nr:YARHG domain-containing protein [Flaviaesturariibacter flavus]TCJ13565.1 YARHG domain-containing protein [Flaviaesturariibacter flavus]